MSKPIRHAHSSVRRYNCDIAIPLEIHNLFDSSKAVISDNRHRTLTHHSWFGTICERVFGFSFPNDAGRLISVRDIAEDHLSEDHLGYHPAASDYLSKIVKRDWMEPAERITTSEQARRSAAEFGGTDSDYLDIHQLIDSSESVWHDCRHGVLTHTPFFFGIVERIIGDEITVAGQTVSVREVCIRHVEHELGVVHEVHEWLEGMPLEAWMSAKAGTYPPSAAGIAAARQNKRRPANGRIPLPALQKTP